MLRAKICGITNEHDAAIAINLGAWAIGFNFYRNSPRYVSLEKAKKIVSSLPAEVVTVGILINYSEKEVVESLEVLDFIQVYENKPLLN
jgi:phosphoribosylanthranilate isomerase